MKDEKTITCRVCLASVSKRTTKYLSLFEIYNDCFIADKINCIANVKIKQGDGLPDRICPDCLLQLENAVAFKLKCETTNVILHNAALTPDETSLFEVQIKKENEDEEVDWLDENFSDLEVKAEQRHIDKPELVIEHLIKKVNLTTVECNDCGQTFRSKCKLRIHWRIAHLPDKLTCPSCKRMFKSYKAFNVHKKKKPRSCVVGGVSRIEGKGKFRIIYCTECEYHTKRLKDMDSHRVIHTGDRRFSCNKCPKVFSQQSSLQGHLETIHKDYLIETTCQYCGKHIKGRTRLYRHLKSHTEARVQCEVCKKYLKNKKNLINHMRRHTGVKSCSCEICAKTFYTIAELCNHRTKVHFKSKCHKCDLCGYMMYTAVRLKIHKAKHSETNVVCLICGIFAESKEMLAVHQKRHFERNSQCPHCDLKFYNRKSRSKHVRAKHKSLSLVNKVSKQSEKVNNLKILSNFTIKQECPTGNLYDKALGVSHTVVVTDSSQLV